MSNEILATIAFNVIAFSWMVYLVQELFIAGSSAMNMAVVKSEGERRQIQVATGIHWDGIEVWLIAAIALTFGAFPLAFGTVFTYYYVVLFLLVYALIGRGVSIEVIYKIDSKRWLKSVVLAWTISSTLILFILGVFITNTFLGFPYDANGEMSKSFVSAFNVTSISGGLLFVALGLIAGSGWINLTTEGELGLRANNFVKKFGVIYAVPILILLVFMGYNNSEASLFIGELFTAVPLMFVLPIFTITFALITTYCGYKGQTTRMFNGALLTMVFFLITGFMGSFPYIVPSYIAVENGITIFDAMAASKSLSVILIAIAIFYPIIIGYQTWKYIMFTKKVKFNDE